MLEWMKVIFLGMIAIDLTLLVLLGIAYVDQFVKFTKALKNFKIRIKSDNGDDDDPDDWWKKGKKSPI